VWKGGEREEISLSEKGQKKRESYKDVLFLRGIAIALVPQQQRQ
jgi:hypothetical protein